MGIRPQCHAIHVDRWRDARLRENTKKRCTKGERIPHQEAERTPEVERRYNRIEKNLSARREKNLRGKE